MNSTGEALLASLGELYSKEVSTVHYALCEAVGNVLEDLFPNPEQTETLSSIIPRSFNGVLKTFDGLKVLNSALLYATSNSTLDETRVPWIAPQASLGQLASESWCSGSHELIVVPDDEGVSPIPDSLKAIICNHISPWTDVRWEGTSTVYFELGTTELL